MTTEAKKATSVETSHWGTVVRLAGRAFAERRRRRRIVDALMALDDHTLRDSDSIALESCPRGLSRSSRNQTDLLKKCQQWAGK